MSYIRTIEYDAWQAFKNDLYYDLVRESQLRRGQFLFRGQSDADWKLTSSFDRWFERLRDGRDRIETSQEMLRAFIREAEGVEAQDAIRGDEIRALALGQHFGLPTRLLDWTESPYVAAFFAFSDYVGAVGRSDNVAIWALNTNSKIWNKEMGVEIVNVTSVGNVRLYNQSGIFTLSRTPFGSLEDYVENCGDENSLIKIVVNAGQAELAIRDLDFMGINHARVYPELVGAAQAARTRTLLKT